MEHFIQELFSSCAFALTVGLGFIYFVFAVWMIIDRDRTYLIKDEKKAIQEKQMKKYIYFSITYFLIWFFFVLGWVYYQFIK